MATAEERGRPQLQQRRGEAGHGYSRGERQATATAEEERGRPQTQQRRREAGHGHSRGEAGCEEPKG